MNNTWQWTVQRMELYCNGFIINRLARWKCAGGRLNGLYWGFSPQQKDICSPFHEDTAVFQPVPSLVHSNLLQAGEIVSILHEWPSVKAIYVPSLKCSLLCLGSRMKWFWMCILRVSTPRGVTRRRACSKSVNEEQIRESPAVRR